MVETTTVHREPVVAHEVEAPMPPGLLKRISWGAIFAGAIIAVGVTILLGLLGSAIGARAIDPAEAAAFEGVGIGTAVWWIATSIVALAIGGFVAGRTSGQADRFSATAHGAATWALATIATLWLASSALGTVVNTATGAITTVARASASVVGTVGGAVLPGDVNLDLEAQQTREAIRSEASQILRSAGITQEDAMAARNAAETAGENILRSPGDAGAEIDRLVDRLFTGPDAAFSPEEREQLVQTLATRAGVTPQEAETIARRWESQANTAMQNVSTTVSDVRDEAGKAGEQALDLVSTIAWYAFFASLLSLLAAVLAAGAGAPRHGHAAYRETVAR